MLITLWNYIRGYVIIEVTGKGAIRFLNIAARSGTYIWDVAPSSCGLYIKVSVPAFWSLRKHARKAGCKIRIQGRMGAPFVAHRYRKRKLLVAGALFFVAGLYAMSMFVWQVEVVGANRLHADDVVQAAATAGLRQSVFRPHVNRNHIEHHLLSSFEDIAWVSITLRGTRATISITETLPRQIIIDRLSPADVVAARDGLIVSIVASGGTPKARVHDVVSAGDILVSSEIIVREDDTARITDHVHADARVLARVYYDFSFAVPYLYSIKNYTGNERTSYGIILFGRSFALPSPRHSFHSYTRQMFTHQLSLGLHYPLPATIVTRTYREFTATYVQRTPEEARALAEAILDSRISAELPETTHVIDRQVSFYEHNPGALIIRAAVAAIEDIAEKRLMLPN